MDSNIETMDKYTAGIELSNKCRQFYQKRMETAEDVKQRFSPILKKERKKSTLDVAMEKLGNEMVSILCSLCNHL
jgi:septum formation topological specificity factor MinE